MAPALLLLAAGLLAACGGRRGPAETRPYRPPIRTLTPETPAKIEGDLLERLASEPGERFRALVDLTEQVDRGRLYWLLRERHRGKRARRAAAVGAFEWVARRQQDRLRPDLDRLMAAGDLDYVRPVAIVNRLLVEGRGRGILALLDSPEVAWISADWSSASGASDGQTAPPRRAGAELGTRFVSWAVEAMLAGELWAQGLDGTGVVVATIDTGAYAEHEQLRGRRLPESRGWFDPVQGSQRPSDIHGHGTAVLSLAVGANPQGRIVGIAPEARWAAGLGNWQNYYSKWRMTEAADWVLRVARPDVLVNAWSHDEGVCPNFDLAFIDAWRLAETFVVFPAGNAGPGRATGESPADLEGLVPDGGPVLSVAALDRFGGVHDRSSRGPSRCRSSMFPGLAAPGGDLPFASTGNPSAYQVGWGTSLASGLVGGGAALLLQAEPELSPLELERLLLETARDLPPPGPDPAAGVGRIDLAAALRRLRQQR